MYGKFDLFDCASQPLWLPSRGPGHLGFFESDFRKTAISWDGVTRPAMIATGDGDARCEGVARDACEDTPMLRRIAFERMRPPDKYLMYINDARTFHNIFAMKTSECAEENVPSTNCQAFASWLVSSVLAFLDSYIEQRLTAETWLRNSFLATASGGVAQLERQ
jgi:hypothetical protein